VAGMTASTTPTTADAIVARGLIKRFGATTAVDGVDLSIAAGTVFGLLGHCGRPDRRRGKGGVAHSFGMITIFLRRRRPSAIVCSYF
jgi:ABC-type branched-subunit amino acid transport system ATPase component